MKTKWKNFYFKYIYSFILEGVKDDDSFFDPIIRRIKNGSRCKRCLHVGEHWKFCHKTVKNSEGLWVVPDNIKQDSNGDWVEIDNG